MGVHLLKQIILPMIMGLSLLACEPDDKVAVQHDPVAFESADECHLCGMIITRFPGPKGEAFVRHNQAAFKFCSTRDLFAWLLQPDVTSRVEAVYVHDMARTTWEDPEDNALIDGYSAWYVVGSERTGAMGSTLASFAEQKSAADFARQYGGKVLAFDDITLHVLQ